MSLDVIAMCILSEMPHSKTNVLFSYPQKATLICVLVAASDSVPRLTLSLRPQLDISPCSYQSNSVLALILLYLAVPFLQPQAVFVNIIKNCKKKRYHILVN